MYTFWPIANRPQVDNLPYSERGRFLGLSAYRAA